MKVFSTRTHFDSGRNELGLTETINKIGYENVLQILPCYCGDGECFYTIIYKEEIVRRQNG
jgi:hypothetical protein